MIFLFPRWDMLIPWRVFLSSCFFFDLNCGLFTLFFFPDKSSEARFLNKFPAQLTFSYFIYSTLESHFYIWVFPKIGVPQNGWFLLKKLIKMDDLGYHCFRKHPYSTFALRPVICPRVIFRSSVLNRDEWIIRQFWSLYWWFPMVLERNQPYFRKIFNIHIYIQKRKHIYIPWGSMYGIFTYIWAM